MRVTELETGFQSFAAQFELEVNRSKQKLARLKRDLARERGEDMEEEEPGRPGPAETAPVLPLDGPHLKADLRRKAGLV